jgi:arylsulfatase A-like enzyme
VNPSKKPRAASDQKPNIVFFLWDNLGWGEVGCYGGGVLRGAPTPRIDALASQGLRLLNFNVEAQCTPSRSAILTGRHPIRSGTHTIPITGGAGRIDPLRGEHRADPLRFRVCDGDVGQMASGQRSGTA